MSESFLLQLLQPMTYLIFAAGFAAIYFYSRQMAASRLWAIAYMFAGLALFGDLLRVPGLSAETVLAISWITNISYLLGACYYTSGHFVRLGVPLPVHSFALAGAGVVLALLFYHHIQPSIALRTAALQTINALVFLLAVRLLLTRQCNGKKLPMLDRVAGWVLAAFAGQLVLRAIFLVTGIFETGPDMDSYLVSASAVTFRISLTIAAVASAVILYVILGAEAMRDLRHDAEHDRMTGLWDRTHFISRASAMLHGRRRKADVQTLFMCDLDHFKSVNDEHGHAMGDDVIVSFAKHLRTNLRDSDIIGRVGGEEFAALLPGCDAKAALRVCELLRGGFENQRHGDVQLICTASFGIAEAAEGETYESLFARADAALYSAKHGGRNRVRVSVAAVPSAQGPEGEHPLGTTAEPATA